jgi:predicted nucleic-acid-binding protein
MRAVDTNILVRLIVDADAASAKAAARAIAGRRWYVSPTVLIELEWVLRFSYRFGRKDIARAMRDLFSQKDATVGVNAGVVDAYSDGVDFADAVHLAMAAECADFLTFDRDLLRLSQKLDLTPQTLSPS